MPRTNTPAVTLVANAAGTAPPAGTTVDPTNNHIVPVGTTDRLLILANNTHATLAKTVTVKAGGDASAVMTVEGDLVVSVPAVSQRWIGPLKSSRFMQNGSVIWVDVETGMTGTLTVLLVPKTGG